MNKPLSDILQFKNGKKRPSEDGSYPVYGGNGILGYADQSNYTNCIAIGRVGAYCGSVYYEKDDCWISDNAIAALPKTGTDLRYAYHLLRSLKLNSYHIGTSQPLLTQEILNRISTTILPPENQKRVGAFLGRFDEIISKNEQINDILLKQAKAIFKREFLSFDAIPYGWVEDSLLGIADYLNGLAMQKYRPHDGETGLPVLKIKELRQGFCDSNSELCSPSIRGEYVVHDGDVIFSWSGSLLVDFWCGGECGLNQHLFKVTSKKYDKWFYYAWTDHHLQEFVAIAADKATTMGHIKREELSKAKVLIPPKMQYDRIGNLLAPIYDLVIANRVKNRKLAELRDQLLPRLMSGELDASEVPI